MNSYSVGYSFYEFDGRKAMKSFNPAISMNTQMRFIMPFIKPSPYNSDQPFLISCLALFLLARKPDSIWIIINNGHREQNRRQNVIYEPQNGDLLFGVSKRSPENIAF